MWSLLSTYIILTVFVPYKVQEQFVVTRLMKYVITVPEDVVGTSHTYLLIKAAISMFIDACDEVPLIFPKMQEQKLLTLH
jgi:hypothetical protein